MNTLIPLYCNCTCKSSSTLIDSNISGNLVSSSKTKWKYNTQLSNSLNWKPAGASDSLQSWNVLVISRCWNVDNSSEKNLFLGRLRIVCGVGNEDGLLKSLWG